MSIENNIVNIANTYFSFLNYFDNSIFWITSHDYGKQYYLSNGYETIWERPAKEIFRSLKTWETTVLENDLAVISDEMQNRSLNKAKGYCAYRIHVPNGNIKYIKNIAHTFTDANGKPLFIVGIDESVTKEQWDKWQININENKSFNSSELLTGFQRIIEKEMNKSILCSMDKIRPAPLKELRMINIKGMDIRLSKREAEVLDYLSRGMSAKQTAYEMQLSVRTVECYLENLRKKTHCRTKIALVGCLNIH